MSVPTAILHISPRRAIILAVTPSSEASMARIGRFVVPDLPHHVTQRAHLAGRDDGLVEVAPLLERCGGRFADLIAEEPDPARIAALRAAETIGRPLGAGAFLDRVAGLTGRDPRPGKRGARAARRKRARRERTAVERNKLNMHASPFSRSTGERKKRTRPTW